MKSVIKIPFLIFLTLTITCFSQTKVSSNLEDYLKIKLFEHTKEDVEKMHGKPDQVIGYGYWVTYFLQNGTRIDFRYTSAQCKNDSDWNVPDWRIEEITYSPLEERPDLKKLISGKIKFKNRAHGTGDVPQHIEYYNSEQGISIVSDEAEGGEGVMDIIIKPSESDKTKYACK